MGGFMTQPQAVVRHVKPRIWYDSYFGWCCGDYRPKQRGAGGWWFGDTPLDAFIRWQRGW